MAQDKNLTCRDCGTDFVFTASEQDFFAEKGFTNEPGRCPDCRAARKQQNNRGGFGGGRSNNSFQQREMHDATCAACGIQTQVPFRPSNDRPIYCRDCFQSNKRY
ncbi:zinc-ribbon domain containing protein [Dendrosporobacter sp. 1207_IL3150]|uniref:zinc-ribbon domain containing protein n=1 Tax=Dendrosporobacter sp. 1207_IL3150 TaxID=3084054 RepID=UPI002FD8D058